MTTAQQLPRPAWATRSHYLARDELFEHSRESAATFEAMCDNQSEPTAHTASLVRDDEVTVDGVVEGKLEVYLHGLEAMPIEQVPNLIAALQELLDAAATS